ncbi:MAG TPA: response regulator, partial [bacterium]|nr:response regulator [bacterium]
DFMIRELLKFKLARQGFEVVTAGNEKEFWGKVFETKPDLIILDVFLKNKSGPESYRNLIEFAGLAPGTPVIFITALLEKEMAPENGKAATCALLIKPLDFEELMREIERMLGLNRDKENDPGNEKRGTRKGGRPSLVKRMG